MSTTTSCGQCGAPLRPEQAWCSLCFATSAAGATGAAGAAGATEVDPLTAPLEQLVVHDLASADEPPEASSGEWRTDPADSGTDASLTEEVVGDVALERQTEQDPGSGQETTAHDVDVMLSLLAAEHRQSDRASGLLRVFDDRSARIMVMIGGTVLVAGLGFLVLTLLGAVL